LNKEREIKRKIFSEKKRERKRWREKEIDIKKDHDWGRDEIFKGIEGFPRLGDNISAWGLLIYWEKHLSGIMV
jgi:hypothetical protein